MKAISFLGTANYSVTTYVYQDKSVETRFFPAAVARFVEPEQLLICATPTVCKHANLAELGRQLDAIHVPWQVVPIPEGHSEADLWTVFDALTNAVDVGETVSFDVTHSFRSLPILAFLAVAYLKAAKRVDVQRVLYGAWEARDEAANRSPVFDLTPFVVLLDWLTATTRFVETGDSQALATLLRSGIPGGPELRDSLQARALRDNLKSAAEAIESISLALRLARPTETMQSAAHLGTTLSQSAPGISQRAKPFALLAEQIRDEYGQFALPDPAEPAAAADSLRRQLKMIEWYLQRRHVVQASTLAREWVVSLVAFHLGEAMYERGRRHIEAALNNAVERRKPAPRAIAPGHYDAQFEALPQAEAIARLWSQLTDLRNDIAHVGMRVSPQPAALLKQKVELLYPQLVVLADHLLPAETFGARTGRAAAQP